MVVVGFMLEADLQHDILSSRRESFHRGEMSPLLFLLLFLLFISTETECIPPSSLIVGSDLKNNYRYNKSCDFWEMLCTYGLCSSCEIMEKFFNTTQVTTE